MNLIKFLFILFIGCLKSNFLCAQLFYNNGAIVAVKTGATLIVKTGAFTNNAGIVDNAGTINVEGTFTNNATANGGAASGIYKIQNDWVNNGTFTPNLGQVELYGANQLITGTSITDFSTLSLIGTGIKTQTINSNVNSLLELNDRELATNTNKMNVLSTNINAITRTTGFVSSLGNGRLARAMAATNAYLFPVGSSIGVPRYRPIAISPSSIAPQQLEVRLANVDASTEGYNRNTRAANICDVNPNYYHLIDRSTGAAPVTVAFFYDPIADGSWAAIGHWQNIPQWQNTSAVTAGVAPPFSTLTLSNWNDFTLPPFALVNLGPNANITGSITLCQGAATSIAFNGTPNATVSYNVNGGATLTIVLNALGQATINTGNLTVNTTYNLLSASIPGPPLCVQSFASLAIVVVTPTPILSPVFHD